MAEGYPIRGELVIVSVDRVTDHGGFVTLDEYGNKQGIVSLREFSQKWVKNPRDYMKEGSKSVLKVLRINVERGHIDLSLKEVNENEKRNKIKEYQLGIRVKRLMDHFAKNLGKKPEELYSLFGKKLAEDYGSLYEAFTQVSNQKEDLKSYIADEKMRETIIKSVTDSIKPTFVSIRGFVSISSDSGNGLDVVKSALLAGEKAIPDGTGSISYISSPEYRIDITSEDYKSAEKLMKECYAAIEAYAKSKGAESTYSREPKKQAS